MPQEPNIRLAAYRLRAQLANQTIVASHFTPPVMQNDSFRIRGRKVELVTYHAETRYYHNLS